MLGYRYKCYSGYRSHDEQRKLYEAYLAGGAKAAPPGLSAHNYGLAIDCALISKAGTLSWSGGDYETLLKVLPKHNLLSGRTFSDTPHVQWPGYVDGRQLLPLKKRYNAANGNELEKLIAVWATLE
jgi:peptidoglycan L-alanyl-D-glutamate endopeptidase CwlK